ncbi:MAG: tyrosine-type recombinase/integrase [Polyangiaceae bacterium]
MMTKQWVRKWNSWVEPQPALPGVYRRKEGGFLVRGRAVDPKNGATRQVVRSLPDLVEPEEARLWLKGELESIRKGVSRATNKQPECFATYAASLLRTKIEKRQICSSKTEEKWLLALRHLFGLKDNEGNLDVGIHGLGGIFVDKLTRADVEAWRDSWEPRINAGAYAPTTINEWIAVLRVITKKMKADFGLPVDPCADVEDVSTKGHRTYTFEQPNSLDLHELSRFFEIASEKYPQHFAVILLGSVTGLRPSSLYALRRCGEDADVKWDKGLVLIRRSRGVKGRVMEMTKTNHDQVIKLPEFVMSVLRWHVDKQLVTREMERSELLFPSETGGFRSNSALAKPFRFIAKAMGLKKQISPKAMRRSFQDAMREAQVANVVVRSISGHLTDQMQQRYSTARGHEQESAIARIIDLTRLPRKGARGPQRRHGQQSGQRWWTA